MTPIKERPRSFYTIPVYTWICWRCQIFWSYTVPGFGGDGNVHVTAFIIITYKQVRPSAALAPQRALCYNLFRCVSLSTVLTCHCVAAPCARIL